MGLFDKLFKKNAFDKKMDEAFDSFVENNPITRKTKETIAGAQEEITRSLPTAARKTKSLIVNVQTAEKILHRGRIQQNRPRCNTM